MMNLGGICVFTGAELDAFRGPWSADRIKIVHEYCKEGQGNSWTEREIELGNQLLSALEVLSRTPPEGA